MNIIEKKEIEINGKSKFCEIVKFSKSDFHSLKKFVLEETNELNDEYFITNDIDTALPEILNNESGKVFGIIINKKLVSILGIDYRMKTSDFFCNLLNINSPVTEVGWALVKVKYRGNNLFIKLNNYLEKIDKSRSEIQSYVTTVHPENISGLLSFFKAGYIGLKIFSHYGSIRMIMAKNIEEMIDSDDCKILQSSIGNLKEQKKYLDNSYICTGLNIKPSHKLIFKKRPID